MSTSKHKKKNLHNDSRRRDSRNSTKVNNVDVEESRGKSARKKYFVRLVCPPKRNDCTPNWPE